MWTSSRDSSGKEKFLYLKMKESVEQSQQMSVSLLTALGSCRARSPESGEDRDRREDRETHSDLGPGWQLHECHALRRSVRVLPLAGPRGPLPIMCACLKRLTVQGLNGPLPSFGHAGPCIVVDD